MDDLPPFTPTPEPDVAAKHERVVSKFSTHTTRPLEYRRKQLQQLYWGIKDAEGLLNQALQLDLGKSAFESYISEVGWCLNDTLFMLENLEKWMKDESAEDQSLTNKLMKPMIRKDPLGAVLIIGTWNFPINLTIGPLIGAIAAGCTAVIKPSEVSTNCSRVMQHIIEQSLDPEAYQCVQGGIPETTAALKLKWDKIFYTGNANVAKIIAKAAAEHLTPVTLELGGRNPAIVTKNADTRLAARRLLWAKLFNAGQLCISHNYTMVDKEVLPAFLAHLGQALQDFQPQGAKDNADYSRMVSQKQWSRVKSMLDNTKGKIIYGGATDESALFIEPTVIQVDSMDDALLTDESFGPLIPILPVIDLDEAIRTANTIHATPLALYTFGSKAENAKVLSQTRSGGASMNDSLFHASLPTMAFGGVGDSGTGAYRGKSSFDCFTHRRSITTTPGWMESLLSVRYPPYTDKKLKQMKGMGDLPVTFDRQGRVKGGMVWWVLGLGGKGWGSAGTRWAVLSEDDMMTTNASRPGSVPSKLDNNVLKSDIVVGIVAGEEVRKAEHDLCFFEALKLYPTAVFWSFFFSLGIIMTAFDPQLLGNLYATPAFQKDFGYLYNGSYIVSAPWQTGLSMGNPIGQVVGAFVATYPMDLWGRKRTFGACVVLTASFIFIQFFARSLPVLLVGELLGGLVLGTYATIAPTYASEVCPVALRGVLTSYINLCFVIGQLIANGICKGTSTLETHWAYSAPFASQWFWCLVILIGFPFAPESPWWLCRQNRLQNAENSLRRLASEKVDVKPILDMIIETDRLEQEMEAGTTYMDCFKKINRRRSEIAIGVYSIQVVSGIYLVGYATYFFTLAGLATDKAFDLSIGFLALGFVGTIFSWVLLVRFGRRIIYNVGLAILVALLLLIGILDCVPNYANRPKVIWAQSALMLVWNFSYDFSVGPVCFVILCEVSATKLRSKTVAVATAVQAFLGIIMTIAIPQVYRGWF
ncbi:hypothetical protein LTR62_006719 [Meristemomyces frigidus]|uniref:Beta-apo-4'-carotenal oxygenase n=1 Tax=Meristemomyces frigidus TaxID=1508187 RepID=A0AAN7TVQ6_9PEZI|nr:hypothetical protein LTR62_006719 [Meristemomyces frigidus]